MDQGAKRTARRHVFEYRVEGVRSFLPFFHYVWSTDDRDSAKKLAENAIKKKWPNAKFEIVD